MKNYLNSDEPSYFSIFQKDKLSFIGTIFLTTRNQKPGEILLGYLIDKEYWGNNYAKEAIYALLYCLFPIVRPEITTVLATTRDDNLPSIELLHYFNFQCVEEIEKFNQKRLLYKIDVKKLKEAHQNIEIKNLS
jgi:RimJ/RimL family protein N-acetyltransferase